MAQIYGRINSASVGGSVSSGESLNSKLRAHISDHSNPHAVTAAQVGAITQNDMAAYISGEIDIVNASISRLCEDLDITSTVVAHNGTVTESGITYWSGVGVCVYWECREHTKYTITKTVGDKFRVCYTKGEIAVGTPIFGYVSVDGTSVEITTGADAKYMLVMAATSRNTYAPSAVLASMTVVEQGKAIDESARRDIEDIKSRVYTNTVGCALPKTAFRATVGIPMQFYYDSAVTPKACSVLVTVGNAYNDRHLDRMGFVSTNAVSSANGYKWNTYDLNLAEVDQYSGASGYGGGRYITQPNLSDCKVLCIGDSTVDHDKMTATIQNYFTQQGHTVTLLGTLGDGAGTGNNNEGRAGWTSGDYLTGKSYNGTVNPFYNPTVQGFDFNYYMTNQGYTGVDYVVIQLGINDLYSNSSAVFSDIWANIKNMIDSIRLYDYDIRVILNLPTTPNIDPAQHSVAEFLYRNRVIRYNQYAMAHALSEYGDSKVRCSYCHLILDSSTEIRDNVHPTNDGYAKMGLEVCNQINNWMNGH